MMLIAPVDFCYRYNALVKQKLLTENLNKKHRWFKCESCETVNEVTNEEAKNLLAQCSCGYTVCMKCLNRAHLPLNCDNAKKYHNIRSSEFFNSQQRIVHLVEPV